MYGKSEKELEKMKHQAILAENMDNAIELATRKMTIGKNEWIREGKMLKLIQQKTICCRKECQKTEFSSLAIQ